MTHYDAKAKLRRTLTASGRGNEAITLDDAKQHLRETLSGKSDSQEIKLDSAGTDWQECSDAVIEKIKQEKLVAARKKLRKTLSSEDSR